MDTFAALRAFVAVVEQGGFAPAGRRLGVATSSVTRQVDALEESLGTLLLNRSTRNVTLTGVGESYFENASRILDDLDSINLEVSEGSGPPHGLIRVSLPVAFGHLHVAPLVAAFAGRYPGIKLDLLLTDEVVDLVTQRLDLAIRLGPVEGPGLIAKALAPHRRVVCASPAYLERHGEPKSPADLTGHNCMTFSYSASSSVWSFSGPTDETIRVTGSVRANNSEVLREAALGGLGLILMPTWLVGADIEAGRLRAVLREWHAGQGKAAAGGIYAVYLPTRRTSAKVRALVDFLVERFGSPPYWETLSPPD